MKEAELFDRNAFLKVAVEKWKQLQKKLWLIQRCMNIKK